MLDDATLEWLASIPLARGRHETPEDGLCALEAAAYLAHSV